MESRLAGADTDGATTLRTARQELGRLGLLAARCLPMGQSTARRISALIALLAAAGTIAVLITGLLEHLVAVCGAIAALAIALGAGAYGLTRTGGRRAVGLVVAVLALVVGLVLLAIFGTVPFLVGEVVLLAITGAASKYALGRDIKSLKAAVVPGERVGRARRPALIMNPKSGGGKVERFQLADEARRRGIEPIVLGPGDDVLELAQGAIAQGADVIGMAGGDGSQALVASVAMHHDVAFVCVPAGTRNHLAADLGLDRSDVVGALDAFGDAAERRIDLGFVGERVFVNNATLGLYAKIVQSPEYREKKAATTLNMIPSLLGPDAAPFDLRFTEPNGTEHASAHVLMVSNGPYELSGGEGFGSRPRMDTGALGVVALQFRSSNDIARFVEMSAAGRVGRFPGWIQWQDTTFRVTSHEPLEVGIDGEALTLDPPLEFRTAPAALRVRLPLHAPGYSSAAAAPRRGWSLVTDLLRIAAGRAPFQAID